MQDAKPPKIAVLSTSADMVDREEGRSLEEMIFETSRDALARAGLDRTRLDGIVLSGNDQTDGRVISCMPSAGPAGGVDRDVTMIASSGEHALVYGYLRLLAGQGNNVLIVGWSKPSESVHPEHAELVSAEPYLLREIGMNHTLAAALQASRLGVVPSGNSDQVVSWPLSKKDLPPRCDAVLAAVLAVDGSFPSGTETAWIKDAGWSTDRYELGARDLTEHTSLRQAVASLSEPQASSHWDAIEIAAPSQPAVHAATATLDLKQDTLVNASGSLADSPAPAHVAGFARLLAAANAVNDPQDRSHPVRLAAGIGMNGFAGQGATVMVFGKEDS